MASFFDRSIIEHFFCFSRGGFEKNLQGFFGMQGIKKEAEVG
jgi:hypothetical protein